MTIEEKLTDLILSRYNSKREFTTSANIPYTTLASILKRGIANSSVGNVIKICRALHISADALAEGRIEPSVDYHTSDIREIIDNAKTQITQVDRLTIDGKTIDIEYAISIIEALDIGCEMVKRKSDRKKP